MCLLFNYVLARSQVLSDTIKSASGGAMAKLSSSSQHDDGSCDNIQIGIICTKTSVDVISRLPVKSKTAKIAMYNVPSECLGNNDKYFVKCDKITCVAHYLKAFMTPGDHVEIPEKVEIAVYRSLCAGSATPAKEHTRPMFTFPKGKCITDANGTKFLFKSGAFAKTDEQISAAIQNGTFRDRGDYLLSMKDAAWKEFTRQLKNNAITMSMLFECTGEFDEDGNEMVEPEAAVVFMDLLYPNLVPGHDILVCVPLVKEGTLMMESAFNVRLSYPHFPLKIAIMGAQHNDMATEGFEQEVEENFYIYSNMDLRCGIPDVETMTTVPVILHKAESFLPLIHGGVYSPGGIVDDRYEAMIERVKIPDMEAWRGACEEFQLQCREKLFEQLKSDGASYGLDTFDKDTMYVTNIIGMNIPKITTFMAATHGHEQASAQNVLDRMKRKQEGALLSPVKYLAVAPVEASDMEMVPASRDDATQLQPSEAALLPSDTADGMLQKAFVKLLTKPNPNIEAMVVYAGHVLNKSYIKKDSLTLDAVEFQIMTDEHKMKIALLIESMAN